jgi:C_GCAxxG_C_C family probable redox protein
MTTPADTAEKLFKQNFNCSQAVFATFAPRLGISEEAALKLASPFGGGVARRGEICGAVTGALLALGLARGGATPGSKEETYRLAQEFLRQFEAKHGKILCRDLLNFDLSTPAGYEQAKQAGVFRSLCPLFVREAADLLQTFLNE